MRSLSGVVFRLMVLGFCAVLFAYPVSAGQATKTVKDDKAVKAEKAVKSSQPKAQESGEEWED